MRTKRKDEIRELSVAMTDDEISKLNALLKHFNKKFLYEIIGVLINEIPEIERTEIKATPKSLKQDFQTRKFRLNLVDYEFIEKYSQAHFREKNNTIRYFINAGYQIFIEE